MKNEGVAKIAPYSPVSLQLPLPLSASMVNNPIFIWKKLGLFSQSSPKSGLNRLPPGLQQGIYIQSHFFIQIRKLLNEVCTKDIGKDGLVAFQSDHVSRVSSDVGVCYK
ncbi:unnamed protein product [Lactuca saligna]|uniref:Uncharacterized protein n=1 Tax=Lactuca saligna TaxID=75948 RepID=A0AA35ZYB6_LACSI|nr:unnamed protein product [Lactuca saligna]